MPAPLSSAVSAALAGWIQRHEPEILAGLRRLIQFPTVSGAADAAGRQAFERHVHEAHHWLICEAGRWGLRSRSHRDWALVIEAGDVPEVIGVPLHVDVVPPGEGWRHGDPFSGTIEDGQVWGRGTQDNKGPLMAMLHAVAAIVALGRPLRRRVKLIIGHGEEVSEWEDVEYVRDLEGPPLWSIVPDSSFPLVTGEKGWLNAALRGDWDPVALGEAPVRLESLMAGDRVNIVPDRAQAALQFSASADEARQRLEAAAAKIGSDEVGRPEIAWPEPGRCEIVTHGKRAHGSSPHRGHNAALDLLRLLSGGLGASLGEELSGTLGALEAACRDHLGGVFGVKSEHPFLGATTVSLGVLQVRPGGLEALLNFRPTLGLTTAAALESVHRRIAEWPGATALGLRLEASDQPYEAFLVETSEMAECIAALEDAFRSVTGAEPAHLPMSGSTYAKVFPRAVGFGPCWSAQEPGLFHQIDERIPVASHLRNIRIYAEALARLVL
ncbi:MAG: Sapep family Mn(2+)-dependent dipeptidase [Candidatus Sumerlaeia bacterium]|nr:Sapep family Mn(2+)-dependent dipeptidase [Candidatus Sumerlaeia bacterium]